MAVNQISFQQYPINSNIDPSMFTQLSKLGDVYREAQDRQRKQAALANLGTDPEANLQTLLTSGDPALVQQGLTLQQKDIDRAREDAQLVNTNRRADIQTAILQAQGRRAQGNYDQADRDRANAPSLISQYLDSRARSAPTGTFPAPLPGGAPSAFPAPLPASPRPQAAIAPDVATTAQATAPEIVPTQETPQPALPSLDTAQPTAAPAALPPVARPPIMAADDAPAVRPSWLTGDTVNDAVAGRIVTNLTSAQPAADAGINRELLGKLYANPETKALAVAFLQKQFDPGSWTYHNVGGKLWALNSADTSKNKVIGTVPTKLGEGERLIEDGRDVTPPGGAPHGKAGLGQPTYTRDDSGKIHQWQLSTSGVPVEVQFGEGHTPLGPGEVAAQKQEAVSMAKAKAAAVVALPKIADQVATNQQAMIDLEGHKGRDNATGKWRGQLADTSPLLTQEGIDFRSRFNHVKSQAFLSAFDTLRGAGAISNAEGDAAKAAINRLSTVTSEGEFNAAVKEAKQYYQLGLDRTRRAAKGDFSEHPPELRPGDWASSGNRGQPLTDIFPKK